MVELTCLSTTDSKQRILLFPGIEGQGFTDVEKKDGSCIASCIRGLVEIKDSQINALMKERDELCLEIGEKRKIENRQLFQLSELQKENDEIQAKMESYQAKYRKLKEEKEDIRKSLLMRNAADKITNSYISKLKVSFDQLQKPYILFKNTSLKVRSSFLCHSF